MLARYKNKDMLLNIAPHPLIFPEVSNMQFPADDEIWSRGVPMTEGIKLRATKEGLWFRILAHHLNERTLYALFKAAACWGKSLSCSSNAMDGVTV